MSRIVRKDSSRFLVLVVALLLSSTLVSGCQGSGSTTPAETDNAGLALEASEWDQTQGYPTIVASVRNTGNYKLSYAEITFVVKDMDGNQLDTVSSTTTDLEPNGVWKVVIDVLRNDRPGFEAMHSAWYDGKGLKFSLGHLSGHR